MVFPKNELLLWGRKQKRMAMSNYKWYVVWVGNNPGIYETWEDCRQQVENFPGARYKGFKTREEAILALRGDRESEMGILRSIANAKINVVNYEAFPEIIVDSIAVDAACSGNPGVMEYRGVSVRTGEQIFHKGPFPNATNNIGEFLAIVHALALLKQRGDTTTPIYSDSRTGMAWVRDRMCKSKLAPNEKNAQLLEIVRRAETWLRSNACPNRIIKWNTEVWGEIPADFGRK